MRELLIDREVLLLDMGGTFMFGCDRFADPYELGRTYRRLGGQRLSDREVAGMLYRAIERMDRMYVSELHFDAFPAVRDVLLENDHLHQNDVELLDEVFARHEVGTIPGSQVRILKELAEGHRLGVVSNVWAPSSVFKAAFDTAGVSDLFEAVVFSSDYGCIKPSAQLFRRALDKMQADASQAAFVGDDLRCDISGAKKVGMVTAWINPNSRIASADSDPDFVIRDLGELLSSAAPRR